MRTRIKICGITRPEDGVAAADAGADAIGLVFYEPSPRAVDPEQAKAIVAALPAFVTTVGLFVDAEAEWVRQVLKQVRVDCLQFHGCEDARYCEQFDQPYIKAVRMQAATNVQQAGKDYNKAQALLLDTYSKDVAGGTGQQFDWSRVPDKCTKPIILAGGLTPENIVQAIEQARPYAVDVSGGVESAKGIKDHDKMREFVKEVYRVGTS